MRNITILCNSGYNWRELSYADFSSVFANIGLENMCQIDYFILILFICKMVILTFVLFHVFFVIIVQMVLKMKQ